MIHKFETSCDMGSIKIFNDTMACFFPNELGDLPTTVYVREDGDAAKDAQDLPYNPKRARFIEHFTVKTEAYLSEYDCGDEPIYTFSKGRWFVYLLDEAVLLIEKADEDIHA